MLSILRGEGFCRVEGRALMGLQGVSLIRRTLPVFELELLVWA